ncbi:hypothetical protein N2152v2_009136 [Parachlorella kessleri]
MVLTGVETPTLANPRPTAAQPDPWEAAKLALQMLRPDLLLGAATAAMLVLSIATTLAFPLAMGGLFDVVRQHSTSAAAAAASAAPAAPPGLLGLPAAGLGSAPPTFRRALLQLAVCLVLSPIAGATVGYLAPLLAERFGSRLRKHLVQEVLRKDQAFFDRTSKGDLIGRLTLDVATLQNTLSDLIGQRGLRSLLEVLGPMLIIAWRQPVLAIITCCVTPVLSRALRSVVVRSTKLSYERQEVASAALEFASERLSHVQIVQVFGQEEREAAGFRELAAKGLRVSNSYAMYQGLVEGAGRLAVNVGTIALLGLGGLLVIRGQLTVGTLLSYMVYNLFISLGLSQLAASLGDVGKAIGALERISDLVVPASAGQGSSAVAVVGAGAPVGTAAAESAAQVDTGNGLISGGEHGHGGAAVSSWDGAGSVAQDAEVRPPSLNAHGGRKEQTPAINGSSISGSGSMEGAATSSNGTVPAPPATLAPGQEPAAASPRQQPLELALRDVWFRYQGRDDWALRGLSLTVPAGSTLALVGPSGGGKSTVASLLLGLYQPTRGEVVVGGEPMRGQGDWERVRHRIAAVLQQPMLMSGSVAQQIAYGRPDATFEEVVAAAKQANADGFIRELPQGYESPVGERGHALSGGQKQRLAIARALLCRPQVLVLDEVTSALDVESEVAIDGTLAQLEGCTKLVIAHRLSTVRSADQIAVVVDGQVVEQGTHEELVAVKGGMYQRLILAAEL